MAHLLKNVFGGASPSNVPPKAEDDFADFPVVPNPSVSPIPPIASHAPGVPGSSPAPYTKWYRVWERTTPKDFLQEGIVFPFILLILAFHFWGIRWNKKRAKEWAVAHLPALQSEFAVIGYGGIPKKTAASPQGITAPESILKEKSAQEFQSYATGRQNVAFLDVSIKLLKRYNVAMFLTDFILSLFFEGWSMQADRFEAAAYTFDGKEKELVPTVAGNSSSLKVANSAYDGFIWAIVHKNCMRQFRQKRYDASITAEKENAKLPIWTTVMTESAEITDTLLSPELVKAVEQAGDAFEYLIVTDQPFDKPTKIEETIPRKRLQLSIRLPSSPAGYSSTIYLFHLFLRLPDVLVSSAHFRPEVMRKLRSSREEEIRRLRRADEEEKTEERRLTAEKIKKEERDRTLRNMSAEEQRKYLDREKEREQRKMVKKVSRRA